MLHGDQPKRDESKNRLLIQVNELERAQTASRMALDELRDLLGHQETIREDERIRIAREIHDDLGTLLTGIKACLSVLAAADLSAARPQHPRQIEALALTDTAIACVDSVIANLRPSVLDHLGLWSGLEWYVDQFGQRTGLIYELDLSAGARAAHLNATHSTLLFRVVQESLIHVERHAQATKVAIRAYLHENQLVVEVEDNGRGVVPESVTRGRALDLLSLRERLNYVGGQINTLPLEGSGTRLVVQCPLEKIND